MKKYLLGLFLISCISVSAAPTATTTASVKPMFLTADLQKIYTKYYKAIEAEEKLEADTQTANNELQKLYQEGMTLGKKYDELLKKVEDTTGAITDSAKKKFKDEAEATANEIRQKQTTIAQYNQTASQTIAQRRQSIMNLHLEEIKKEAQNVAQKNGVQLVLPIHAVVYSDASLDRTDEIIAELNKNAPKTLPAPAAASK